MRINRFHAAFILLSLITLLLLVYSVLFFQSASVRTHLGAWVRQMAPQFSNGNADQAPLPAQSASLGFGLETLPAPSATPTQTPEPTQQPEFIGPTETPVYQVIVDPIPDGSIVIPSLGIDQQVVHVAVRHQTWDLDGLHSNIGWLETTGSYPNDDMAMVFVGHVTLPFSGNGGPFLYLRNLKPGDVVEYRSEERTYTYEVIGQTIAEPDEVEHLYQPDGSRLLLVTCTGYNPIEWEYDLRLVIEAVLVSEVEKATPQ